MTKRVVPLWLLLVTILIGGAACRQDTSSSIDISRDFFPIMPWEIQAEKQVLLDEPDHGIDSLRAAGFNAVAFVRPDQLEKAEQAGMRAIVGRPRPRVDWRDMSDEAILDYVEEVVDASGESDALIGYFLADEPGVLDFPALGKAVTALNQLAPGKLAYINLYPNYASTSQLGTDTYGEYLERYVSEVKPQFISYDNYGVEYSMDLAVRARAAKYYTNLLAVRRIAMKYGIPFWHVVSSNQIRPYTTIPSPANLLLQAYTTLAAGARGLTWFTYYAGRYDYAPIDRAGNRTATWSYLKMVNDQVNVLTPILIRLRSTGVYFASPQVGGLPLLPGRYVEGIESPTPVMVGEFSGEAGERYAMVVNLSLERSAKVTVRAQAKSIERVSPVDGSLTSLAEDGSLWLAAGQGMLLRL